jgi:hypothetical protein
VTADELYGLPLDQFTKARDEEARRLRQAGDRDASAAVKALRKPSKSAWAVNQVARTHQEDVERLRDAGGRVRNALAEGHDVRSPSHELANIVDALADAAAAIGGAAVRDDAVTTFRAAAADPARGEEVAAGQLVTPLEASGFDAAGLELVPAPDGPDENARRRAEREARVERWQADAKRARERAELLAEEAAAAEGRAADLRRRADDANTRAAEAERKADDALEARP